MVMVLQRLACSAVFLALTLIAPVACADASPTFADRDDEEVREVDRAFGFMFNPLAMALGVFVGEADFVLGRYAVVAIEGGLYRRGDSTATALGAGLLVYPLGAALRGLYVEPRAVYARPWSEAIGSFEWGMDVLGLGGTAGWQWTWEYGFSVRIGAGAIYFLGDSRNPRSLVAGGAQPVVDGSVGWAF
jgi:hypothetical protein